LAHAVPGLIRLGLLDDNYAWGSREGIMRPDSPYESTLLVQASPSGIELFGWALGFSDFTSRDFLDLQVEWDETLPQLSTFSVPYLPEPDSGQSGDGPPASEA
jgi:hypothetical protein